MAVAERHVERGRFAMQHIFADQVTGEERRSRILIAREDCPCESVLRLEHRAAVDENRRFLRHAGHHRVRGIGRDLDDRSTQEEFLGPEAGDDVPDGDPEVLLAGFGLEDAHALANSLSWGPDGWLYGAQGSTVTANIRGIEFQQGIWRYHPVTHEFELFAEGGGNTWGLDFDEHGNVIAGTNFGEQIGLHQVQGGYYIKGFSKHGPLHNPHTFGYFDHIPYAGFKGGHVTCGGIIMVARSSAKQTERPGHCRRAKL